MPGPSFKAGYRLAGAIPYDLMPTLMWLLDLPSTDELEGKRSHKGFN